MNKFLSFRKHLSKQQKLKLIVLVVLLLFGMGLEVIGLGVLIPLLTVILNPDSLREFAESHESLAFIFNYKQLELILFSLIGICLVYLFKSIYLIFLNYKLNKYIASLISDLSNKMYSNFLNADYLFHLMNDSSDLIKSLQIDINHFNVYFSSFLNLTVEFFLCIAILTTLIYVEPLASIIVFSFILVMGGALNFFSRYKLSKWAIIRQEFDTNLTTRYIESIQSIREIVLFSKTSFFEDKVREENIKKAIISTKQMTLKQVPRYYLEFISILGLTILIYLMSYYGKNTNELITSTSLFVAATFRILPSINKILQSLQSIRFYQNSLMIVKNRLEIKHLNSKSNDPIIFEKSIKLTNVSYKYPNTSKNVIEKAYLDISKNTTIGIVGTTGSGKSTIVDLISGLIQPNTGKILVDDQYEIYSNNNWKSKIGYISQQINLFEGTLAQNIAFGLNENEINYKKIESLVRQIELFDFVDSKPEGINYLIKEKGKNLSGGQKQRIGIARALYRDPEILILDEATSALDVDTEDRILKTIKSLTIKRTIITITHRPSSLSICDKVYKLIGKKLIEI
jgi:ATP-binding cassette, subfamily B, bacterial PglK